MPFVEEGIALGATDAAEATDAVHALLESRRSVDQRHRGAPGRPWSITSDRSTVARRREAVELVMEMRPPAEVPTPAPDAG